jgi:hypothetical protein
LFNKVELNIRSEENVRNDHPATLDLENGRKSHGLWTRGGKRF